MKAEWGVLWRFSAMHCDTRAICWTRSSAVTRLPSFVVEKQHREQHWTKNTPKTATNCVQITHKTQRQPHVKVSKVYFHIHNFILAFWEPKWITHTKSYSEGHITRSYSHFELGPPVDKPQAAQTHVTSCNIIFILTFGEAERDLWASRYRVTGDR